MRIVSLLSSATEIVCQLGLRDQLVGISHECDFPPDAMRLPRASRTRFDPAGMDSGEIDAAVRRSMEQFGSVYEVDRHALRELRPDVVLTQAVCEVCAVPTGSVLEAVDGLPHAPEVVSLDAHTLEGILASIRQVADAAGAAARGREVEGALRRRLERVAERVAALRRPRVLLLEWLDPPFTPGHWVPEMVQAAGGENLRGEAGSRSEQVSWEEVQGLQPEVLLVEPCGYDLAQARADANRMAERLRRVAPKALDAGRGWLLHSAWFSRSGPRVVEGVEVLGRVLHPAHFPEVTLDGRAERWP